MTVYRVRASSWASLFDCAYRFEGEQLLGIKKPSSPRALLGKAFHAGTAAFDSAKLRGAPITIDDAADTLHNAIFSPDEEVDWSADSLRANDVEKIALGIHVLYCNEWSHRFDFEAVELTVKPMQIACGGDTIVELTGTLDRMRAIRTRSGRKLQDLKSGKQAVVNGRAKTKGFRPQLGTYEILYEHTTGLATTDAPGIIGAKTVGAPEIALGDAPGAKALMLGDGTFPGLIEIAATQFTAGVFPPNPTSNLCDPRFCARWSTCRYHD